MAERRYTYFVADVHLGLDVNDPRAREARFVSFLRSLDPEQTAALYLLGDIFDFWYEYRDVVPKGYCRVFAAIQDLIEAGVEVYFFQGNHDVWTYSYFEELGMHRLVQPATVEIGGKVFCLGHGDGLGPAPGVQKSRFIYFRRNSPGGGMWIISYSGIIMSMWTRSFRPERGFSCLKTGSKAPTTYILTEFPGAWDIARKARNRALRIPLFPTFRQALPSACPLLQGHTGL